ncbi:MAG: PAS domain-containing sensor histidine kinase [Prolixibacteraceae bacterium]|jgi:PAS domain S-box-containing protein|nr:PAS domain-containing sensor histidine kinase [Prolixibacteraceae bacterium]
MANSNGTKPSSSKTRGKIVSDVEANLSVLFDATDELILLFSNDETILTLNSKAAKSIGYPVEALIGKRISDLLPPEVISHRRPFFDQVLKTGKPCFFEDSRNNRWFYNRIFPTIDEYGKIVRMAVYTRDITDERQAQIALVQSEEKYRRLFETASLGIFQSTLDGQVISVNPKFASMFGYDSPEDVKINVKNTSTQLFADPNRRNELIQQMKDNPALNSFEVLYKRKDGSYFEGQLYVSYIRDEKGEIDHLEGFVKDITKRKLNDQLLKESEEELRLKNEELTQINAEKDKFFSIVTHDLRGPFNSIMGFTQLLTEIVNEKENPEIAEYAKIILKSSEKAMDLLNNLMDWTRSQTGRMKYKPEYFELTNFLHPVLQLFDEIAGQKNISIKKNLPISALVFADKPMIGTIFRNLVSNAIKFTHKGGEVTITAEVSHSNLTVEVRDNGVGIPNESIKRLFRIDQNFTTQGTGLEPGTGLGLILCKEFVDKNKGRIWVESEEGKGSNFYFTIPRHNEA